MNIRVVARLSLVFVVVGLLPLSSLAEVKLPSLFVDHAVLQRRVPLHIWGSAAPAEKVMVTFCGVSRFASADDLGLWSVYLPAFEAGGPFELTVEGSNQIKLQDVLVGDVWLDSGQSNMEFSLMGVTNSAVEISNADHPRIRLFHVERKVSQFPLADVSGTWKTCRPETAARFSAVAYFFGRELQGKLDVPIGLIDASWGGTPAEAWMSLRSLTSRSQFLPALAQWADRIDNAPVKALQREMELKLWRDACERAKSQGKPEPSYPWVENEDNSWMPSGLYNGMIVPLTRYPIRGVIWYQGESNVTPERSVLYRALFETMIGYWRRTWGMGDIPFLFVQLANWRTSAQWPEVREAQLQSLSLPNTGMAVTMDIGDPVDIHPKNKQEVGRRLSLAARAISYGERIEYSGPIFRGATREGNGIRLRFDHTGSGLVIKEEKILNGFTIAGADRYFVRADVRIDGASIIASSPTVPNPMFVRYAWLGNPEFSLYNQEGLPASPFRTDE